MSHYFNRIADWAGSLPALVRYAVCILLFFACIKRMNPAVQESEIQGLKQKARLTKHAVDFSRKKQCVFANMIILLVFVFLLRLNTNATAHEEHNVMTC